MCWDLMFWAFVLGPREDYINEDDETPEPNGSGDLPESDWNPTEIFTFPTIPTIPTIPAIPLR